MKNNAIVRIILLSLAIVILSGILVGGLLLGHLSFSFDSEIEEKTEIIELDMQRTIDAGTIRELEIEWANGRITLEPVAGTNDITVHESGKLSEDYPTVWSISDETLYIGFTQEVMEFPNVGFHESISKDLIIQVPIAWYCEELSIDAASADVTILNMTIDEVDFDGASGTFHFDNCTVRHLDVKTASGDVIFTGSLSELDYSGMSANFQGTLHNAPKELKLDSMSGSLNLHLPHDCGFTMTGTSVSGHINSDFEVTHHDNQMIHGDGACEIKVNTMSGDVNIRKHASASNNAPCDDPNCTDISHNHQTTHNTETHHSESKHH